jgi:hypothetical protein
MGLANHGHLGGAGGLRCSNHITARGSNCKLDSMVHMRVRQPLLNVGMTLYQLHPHLQHCKLSLFGSSLTLWRRIRSGDSRGPCCSLKQVLALTSADAGGVEAACAAKLLEAGARRVFFGAGSRRPLCRPVVAAVRLRLTATPALRAACSGIQKHGMR